MHFIKLENYYIKLNKTTKYKLKKTNNKILITGCAGFIGFHLSEKLKNKKKIQIIGIDNLNNYYDKKLKINRLKILKKNLKKFKFIKCDITDKKKIEKIFKKYKFSHVIHLAAQAGVRYSLIKPEAYTNSNLIGFFNILECSKKYQIRHLIYASSSSIYGENKKLPFSENDLTNKPMQYYAATKLSNELMAYSYSSLYNLKTTGLRFFTVYGPWGRPDMAFFSFTKNILQNKTLMVYNNGKHLRDFTYIEDIVDGIYKIMFSLKKTKKYQLLNIGFGKPIRLLKFINILKNLIGKKAKLKYLPKQPGDMEKTFSSIKNIKRIYNYKPKIKPSIGLKKFVEWYIKYYKMRIN